MQYEGRVHVVVDGAQLRGLVSLSYLPAAPPTDEGMKLQDVVFSAETIIPRFPSVWMKEGGLGTEHARAGGTSQLSHW